MSNAIAHLFSQSPQKQYATVQATSHYLTMRDGVQIAIDVMLPAERTPKTRLPALMVMARYWRSFEFLFPQPPKKAFIGPRETVADYLIPLGFAVVVVDARGTGASTGVSTTPFAHEEIADYGEVAQWIEAQAWCSGNIGALGISYEGATAQRLLTTGVKAVKAVIPQEIEYDIYEDVALPGGIFNLAFIKAWSESNKALDSNKPSKMFPFFARLIIKGVRPVDSDRKTHAVLRQAIQDHQGNTDVYAAISAVTYRDDIFGNTGMTLDDFSLPRDERAIQASGAALFTWGSWLDAATASSALRNFNTLSNPQIVIIGAWKHEMTGHGSPYLPAKTAPNPTQAQQWQAMAQFFDQTLRQETPPTGKKLFYYTLGEEAWKETDTFPLPNTKMQTWYFQANHGLAPEAPDRLDASDSYTVNFDATTGKTNRWHTQLPAPLVYRDRATQDRLLLTYTSEPLTQDTEMTGFPVVSLFVASSEPDCAFFVYLEEVDEKGYVRYLTEGQLRSIHHSHTKTLLHDVPHRTFKREDATPLPVNEFTEVTFALLPVSVLIRHGRCVRVAIAGADSETFARIPAQGTPVWQIARGRAMPSGIQLPIVKR